MTEKDKQAKLTTMARPREAAKPLVSLPAGLATLIERADGNQKYPPVDQWHPEFCGALDLVIKKDGSWHYLGSPIVRPALVRLFASVLRKDEDGQTYLVTPVEKIAITVEDAPFLAVEMAFDGESEETRTLNFRTNLGDLVSLDVDHPMRFCQNDPNGGLKAYIIVRGRLEALLTRALMHDLIALARQGAGSNADLYGIESAGGFFAICPMRDIEE